jgi:HK97 family phage prohead protease
MDYDTPTTQPVVRTRSITAAAPHSTPIIAIDAESLPSGICGRVRGIAVRYGVIDSYGTIFRRGSLDKTRAKVASGKVMLFANHGAGDGYGLSSHVGTVRTLVPEGDGEMMSADLFDTAAGRAAKEYLSAVVASDSRTGLSLGFHDRRSDWTMHNGERVFAFDEIELEEISLTPRNAVPGAEVSSVRHGAPISKESAVALLAQLRATFPPEVFASLLEVPVADDESDSVAKEKSDDESSEPVVATYADRLDAARRTLSHQF